mmetsp:Transcript_94625/g.163391  ORF Transcript_94625/g.163391 Transcript_94625/m.163391 type:complete len:427 (-) Transcript_94625:793-2073(-)
MTTNGLSANDTSQMTVNGSLANDSSLQLEVILKEISQDEHLCPLPIDIAMKLINERLGHDAPYEEVAKGLKMVYDDELIRQKIQPFIHDLVWGMNFEYISQDEACSRIEAHFGSDLSAHRPLVVALLDEEHKAHILKEGEPVEGSPYILGEELGTGHSGVVRKGLNTETGELVALKCIPRVPGQEQVRRLRREIDIMKTLVHENVVTLSDVISTSRETYLIMELVECGTLSISQLQIFPEPEARIIFQQLILGLYYCHKCGVAHRDLKPANLLLTSNGVLKVSDFGLSTFQTLNDEGSVSDSKLLQTVCGSPKYIAPEVLSRTGYNGFTADLWSAGVILYSMLAGEAPFRHKCITGLMRKVVAGRYKIPSGFSPDAADLISKMLVVDPKIRIRIRGIIAHPWFQAGFDNQRAEAIHAMAINIRTVL